jgi:hypothetical protein
VQGKQSFFVVGTEYKGRDLKGTHQPLKALKGHLWLLQRSTTGVEHVLDIYVPEAVSAVCHYRCGARTGLDHDTVMFPMGLPHSGSAAPTKAAPKA